MSTYTHAVVVVSKTSTVDPVTRLASVYPFFCASSVYATSRRHPTLLPLHARIQYTGNEETPRVYTT